MRKIRGIDDGVPSEGTPRGTTALRSRPTRCWVLLVFCFAELSWVELPVETMAWIFLIFRKSQANRTLYNSPKPESLFCDRSKVLIRASAGLFA